MTSETSCSCIGVLTEFAVKFCSLTPLVSQKTIKKKTETSKYTHTHKSIRVFFNEMRNYCSTPRSPQKNTHTQSSHPQGRWREEFCSFLPSLTPPLSPPKRSQHLYIKKKGNSCLSLVIDSLSKKGNSCLFDRESIKNERHSLFHFWYSSVFFLLFYFTASFTTGSPSSSSSNNQTPLSFSWDRVHATIMRHKRVQNEFAENLKK